MSAGQQSPLARSFPFSPVLTLLVLSSLLSGAMFWLALGVQAAPLAMLIGFVSPACCLPWLRAQASEISRRAAETNAIVEGYTRMDATTGLLNRNGFTEKVASLFSAARDEGRQVSAILIDVDHLKSINDEHGSAAGDAVLAHIGNLLTMNIQPQVDIAARYAGAEFVLMLPEADFGWASAFAERLRGTLENRPVQFNGKLIPVSASFGIASIMADDREPETLIRRARKALGCAKTEGRNTVRVAAEQLPMAA